MKTLLWGGHSWRQPPFQAALLLALFPALALAQTITTPSLPNGTVNQPYNFTMSCTNCTGAAWGGTLPPGLSINSSTGTISGTPTVANGYKPVISLQLPGAGPVTKTFSMTISPAPLTITNTSFPAGTVGVTYSTQTLTASGGTPPYIWSATGLPPGLGISGSTLAGTPTTAGTFGFTLTVTDSLGSSASAQFSITISGTTGTLTILNTSFPSGTVGTPYPTQTLSASGGTPPYSWSASQNLPPGLAISGATIVGTPTASGTFAFVLQVFDSRQNSASATLSITINPAGTTPAITTTSLPNGAVNQPYTAQLTCINCAGYTWSVSAGTLPTGLAVDSASGAVTGTPTITGTYNFQIALSPPANIRNNAITQNFAVTINAGGLTITQTSIPVAFQNTPYSTTLTGSGGTPPYTWTFQTTANDGLTIGATTGTISGTPTATGQFGLNVLLTDSGGLTATRAYALNVSASLSILTTTLPNATVNVAYPTQNLQAGGGQPPYRWTITGTGTLPPGLTLDGVFGRISGTPTTAGTYPFTLMVTDNQAGTASASLSITVGGGITISPSTLPGGSVGVAYNQTLTATGGTTPYTWSVAVGSLPAGLTLNASTGVISGTPTAAGTATFTAQATDSTQASGQAKYTLAIVAGPLTVTTTTLPDGIVGVAYSQTLAAMGGTPPYTWAVTTGTLPAGLTLNPSTGAITGTPSAAAATSFTVTVTDTARGTAQQALSITTVTFTVTPTTLAAAVVGVAYTQKFSAAGGQAPYTFATSGTLPAGFTFTAATATLSGTAPAPETGNFTLTVTDSASHVLSVPLTLTATAAPITLTPTTLTAVVGVPFSQVLTPGGGVKPYTFSQGLGSPPAGFTFNTATGTISGTATVAESGVINVIVTDSTNASQTFAVALTVNNPPTPTITVTLSGPTSGFMQQIPVGIAIGAPYPLNITGAVSLTFAPSVTPATGVADGMIQFASGGTVINFTIPAGSTTPVYPSGANATVLTGTTAGTITVTTSLTVSGTALANTTKTIVNAAGVPFISNVSFTQTPGGVTVTVVGFSSTREMVSGLFHFAPATGVSFTSPDITVQLAAPFTTWWSNTAQSNPYGTQFTLTAPFTLSTQSTSVVSVTVTLTNTKGASNPVTLSQ